MTQTATYTRSALEPRRARPVSGQFEVTLRRAGCSLRIGSATTTRTPRSPQAAVSPMRRLARWRRMAGRLATVAGRRISQAVVVCLAIASTSVPAGTPDKTEATAYLKHQREIVARTAQVIEEARVAHIAERYRKPEEQVRRLVRTTERVASKHGLQPELLLAIIETESSFNPKARSGYGARGLMQVVPRFHPQVVAAVGGSHRLDEPEANLEAGARILTSYVERSGSLHKALTRYSGGASSYATKVVRRQRELERVAVLATRQLDATRISALASRSPRG